MDSGVGQARLDVAFHSFDLLSEPVGREELGDFKRFTKPDPRYPRNRPIRSALLVATFAGLTGFILFLVIVILQFGVLRSTASLTMTLISIAFAIAGAFVIKWFIDVLRRDVDFANPWRRWYRSVEFAAANGMTFTPQVPNPTLPGVIFGQGAQRCAYDGFSSTSGRRFDLGNFRSSGTEWYQRTFRRWGFLRIQMDRRLPHMMLVARANRSRFGASTLPMVFQRGQVLSLEGDFDRYFTLYAPREYERDALYIFTPDLMALLIDEAATYDVEIIDDSMYVYSPKPLAFRSPVTWIRMAHIINTVGSKALRQARAYADERVADAGANVVAAAGRRLRPGMSVMAAVALVIGIVMFALRMWHSLSP